VASSRSDGPFALVGVEITGEPPGWHDDTVPHVFRPLFGRVLTVVIALLCAVALVFVVATESTASTLRTVPWLLLVAGACWALFWRPAVIVDDSGVHVVNPLRTIDVPWPAIQDVDTRFALVLVTAYGRVTAWAAPAPGAREVLRASTVDTKHLPRSTVKEGGIRPGDLPTGPSGSAALIIRRHWEQLRDAGYLDDPRLEHERAPVTWPVPVLVTGAVLGVLCLVSLFV
jgi:hypothetical protein